MKRLIAILLFTSAMLFAGCASARNEVSHRATTETLDTDGHVTKREIVEDTASTDGHTFADGKNSIAKLSAGQTPKGGQRIGVTGENQESTSELIGEVGKLLQGLVSAGAQAGAKAVVPVK